MFKTLVCATAIVAAAVSNASAQNVDWRGSALITAASNCDAVNIGPGSVLNARYRHPGLGDNGVSARITFLANYIATNLTDPNGDFSNSFQAVKGTFVGGGGLAYNATLRMLSRTPGITENTSPVVITGIVRNFMRVPGNPSCQITFEFSGMR